MVLWRSVAVVMLGALASAASVSSAWGQASGSVPAGLDAKDFGVFVDSIVRRQVEELQVAGAVVIAVKDGEVIHKAAFGHANVAQNRRMDTGQTVVRLASISKLFTAIAVMQLVEQGRLDLDRDVQDYLDFPVPREHGEPAITLRRLLTHQVPFEEQVGGIGSFSGGRQDLRRFLMRHWPARLDADPGVLSYTNFQFAVVAYVVERVSGELFESYLERHVFAPIGMRSTSARQPLPANLASRVSEGYLAANLPPTPRFSGAAIIHEVGSTGVCASAEDVGRFMIALLENGSPTTASILSDNSLRQMWSSQVATAGGVMGLAFSSPLANTDPFIGHAGGTGGFSSVLALSPADRFGIFVLYNSRVAALPSASGDVLNQVAARYFQHRRPVEADGVPWWKAAEVSGLYQPMRRNESTLYRLLSLLGQTRFVELPDGSLGSGPGLFPFLNASLVSEDEVSFVKGARGMYARIGAPFSMHSRVPFWMRADLIVPLVLGCMLIAAAQVVASYFRRPKPWFAIAADWGLFAQLVAIVTSIWLVTAGDIRVRAADPSVVRIALTIYALAWFGVAAAGVRVWRTAHTWASASRVVKLGRTLSAVAAVVLAAFCIFWKVAGTSLVLNRRDVFFVPGQPRSRKIVQRDAQGRVRGFLDRREGHDIRWTRTR